MNLVVTKFPIIGGDYAQEKFMHFPQKAKKLNEI